MQINFNDSDKLEIELVSRGAANYIYDCNLLVSLKTSNSNLSQEVWVDGYEFKCFLNDLEKLQSSLNGEASITSESPGELLILVKSVDTSGHFALQIELGKQVFIGPEPFWSKVSDAFQLETAFLDDICKEFITCFTDVKNA
ncbi:hypothetical protein K6U21_15360 [Vibrio vulnificus]|uniref:hypothetical protein n=1 Tax=Vibrio vulnificus TaxID=672 RepID=UPI001EE9D29D|nr:hypothetical protein [Vibrio vulnificus]MCG6305538.1 hypothetical protein [Vibrio vulnificus]